MNSIFDETNFNKVLDIVDNNADLLDTSLVDFLIKCFTECHSTSNLSVDSISVAQGLGAVLLDVYGNTEGVIHQLVDVEHWGKWDRIDDWNRIFYDVGNLSVSMLLEHALRGDLNMFGYDDSVVPDIDFVSVCGILTKRFAINHNLSYAAIFSARNIITINDISDKQMEMYIPIATSKKLGGQKLPYPFLTFNTGHLLLDKGGMYRWTATNYYQNVRTDHLPSSVFSFIKITDFIDKVITERAWSISLNNILPKEIVEKYNMPIIEL